MANKGGAASVTSGDSTPKVQSQKERRTRQHEQKWSHTLANLKHWEELMDFYANRIKEQHHKKLTKQKERRKEEEIDLELQLGNEDDEATVPSKQKKTVARGVSLAEMAAEYKLKEFIRVLKHIAKRAFVLHRNLTSEDLGPKYFTNINISQDVERLVSYASALGEIWLISVQETPENKVSQAEIVKLRTQTKEREKSLRDKDAKFEHVIGVIEARINHTRTVVERSLVLTAKLVKKLKVVPGVHDFIEPTEKEFREIVDDLPDEYLYPGDTPMPEKTWHLLKRTSSSIED